MVHLGRIHFFRTSDEFRFEIFRNPWRKSNFRTPTLYELGNQTQNHPKPPILSTWVSTWSPAELNLSSGSSNWCSNDVETSSGRRSEPNDSNLWFKSFNEITIGNSHFPRRELRLMTSERSHKALNCSVWFANQIVCLWNARFAILSTTLEILALKRAVSAGFSTITASDWRSYLPNRSQVFGWLRFQQNISQESKQTSLELSFPKILRNLIGITQQWLMANDDGLGLTHTSTWSLRILF